MQLIPNLFYSPRNERCVATFKNTIIMTKFGFLDICIFVFGDKMMKCPLVFTDTKNDMDNIIFSIDRKLLIQSRTSDD